ncbi:hypothetical protein D9613_007225 [Agrocybe pediades]|uniref:F-box domain-containing protein n=1 Tax=Agrocybe pediades TaxID=84607 RepID=A0A8H4QGI2_9AGAR|nr:hypothetical protein D9613_007225 [Agrocybe pediades]
MVDLPAEIWFNIIDFIPDFELKGLISINSVFLEAGINRKWRRTRILICFASQGIPILKRISDPFVAERVQVLGIQLYCDHMLSPRPNEPTFEDFMDALLQTVPLLRNAYKLNFAFQTFPSTFNMEQSIQSLCHAIGPNFRNVRALTLEGQSEVIRAFVESMPPLPQLKDLKINFTRLSAVDAPPSNAHDLVSHIVPFVNGVSPNLRSLEILCGYDVNISEIFKNLDRMPTIHSLDMQISQFQPLTKPTELFCFLEQCSDTLRNLELRLEQHNLDHWFSDIVSLDNHFRLNLHSLNIVTSVRDRAVDIILHILQMTTATLQKLDLVKTNLLDFISAPIFNDQELSRIVDAASNCKQLRYLRIQIDCLDGHVLDMLASNLPALQTLAITAGTIPILHINAVIPDPDDDFVQPAKKVYRQWHFRDIRRSIYSAYRYSYIALVDNTLAMA